MLPEPMVSNWVDEAWKVFATGNLHGAIDLATLACDSIDSPAAASAALAYFLIQDGRLEEAATVLLPACSNHPDCPQLFWYLGYLFRRQGDLAAAASAISRACEIDPSMDEAAFDLAEVLLALGYAVEAAAWSERALVQKRLPKRLRQMAEIQHRLGREEMALALWREAVASLPVGAPEQASVYLQLADCLARMSEIKEAMHVLRCIHALVPLEEIIAVEAARRLRFYGDREGAFQLARVLVRQFPVSAQSWHVLGVLYLDVDDLKSADECFIAALNSEPQLTEVLVLRARLHRQWSNFEEARRLLELANAYDPQFSPARGLWAQVLLDLGTYEDARKFLVRWLRTSPDQTEAWRLLAAAHSKRGRPLFAMRLLRRVLRAQANNIEALRLYGWLAYELGRGEDAEVAVYQLLECVPDDSKAHAQAALVYLQTGQLHLAQLEAQRAVGLAPQQSEGWRALAQVFLVQRRLDEALDAAQHALALSPGQSDCLRQLGWVLLTAGRCEQAQTAFLRAMENSPNDPVLRLELVEAQVQAGSFNEAVDSVDALLVRKPNWHPALVARARALTEAGMPGAAQACAQLLRNHRYASDTVKAILRFASLKDAEPAESHQWLSMLPANALREGLRQAMHEGIYVHSHSSLCHFADLAKRCLDDDPWFATAALYIASLSSRSDSHALARQSRIWCRGLTIRNEKHQPRRRGAIARTESRPRIAYVMGQMHQSLLVRVLAAHSADSADVFVYSNLPISGLPAHISKLPLSPETLHESCMKNEIDVLIDTGGLHPWEGQYLLLQTYARQIAPVQMGWLGCGTSSGGLFDALLVDAMSVPKAHEAQYDETILKLDGGQWCWEPPATAPDVTPAPAIACGKVTFGVTARSLKLDSACLDAFARVVAATPQSQVRFVGQVASDWPLRRQIIEHMRAQGVDSNRVFFDAFMPHADYLAWLSAIDVVLDSFPGNGGLSLLDPLWMGVPVVTLAGAWASARQGASVLHALGLDQWIAETESAFCTNAVALGIDIEQLAFHRRTMRARILASPLVDGRRIASQIEAFCAQLKVRSIALGLGPTSKGFMRVQTKGVMAPWQPEPRVIDFEPLAAKLLPELSVIVVVSHCGEYSRRCLQALADQQGVQLEVIVVDNAHSASTHEWMNCLHGATVVRTSTAIDFHCAAQQGAEVARGRYLVFLHSDAILQEGALQATALALQGDENIGALGGRVVSAEGGLLDVGGRIYKDGSFSGIRIGEDAFGYAALVSVPTDYVSDIFFATPAHLWRMLDGFECAEVLSSYVRMDYSMRARQAGYRVIYEPTVLLQLMESEYVDRNMDIPSMGKGRQLFCERHAEALRSRPEPGAPSLDADRWCSPDELPRKPRVLFIDNEVPHMLRGGGLPRARMMLQALQHWPVTLFPMWITEEHWHAIYASIPRSVEVALDCGAEGLEAFLGRRQGVYDVLLVSRPQNMHAVGKLRARRPELFAGMQLIYDAEALAALRDIKKTRLMGKPMDTAEEQARLETEIGLAYGAHDVLVVSQGEARFFEAAGFRTHILSHAIPVRRKAPGLVGRTGLLFVGALHPDTPNEDGLEWFVREVMPLLRLRCTNPPVLSVVGVCWSDRIAALADDDVRLLGPQQVLDPYYDTARVFIAPVRYAAGVPAKVIEAVAAGIPVVASTLLAEQLDWRAGKDILGAADAEAFARHILQLLEDDLVWMHQRQFAWEQCEMRYNEKQFGDSLREVLMNTLSSPKNHNRADALR